MTRHSQLARHGLFDANAPRYTSYPTAPHFSPKVDEHVASGWLSAVGVDEPVSVYVHIPFCRRLCWFCACRTQGAKSDRPVEHYLKGLAAEIAAVGERLGGKRRISRLHFGGGTPTILRPDLIQHLAGALWSVFSLDEAAEFSVEIDPTEFDASRLAALRAAGMTRASIGVQDFEPAIQKAIGRLQSYEETSAAFGLLRDAGVESVNADLVYGLPGQTVASLTRTIKRLLWLHPDRIALYGYAHVPNMARRQVMIPEAELPLGPERYDLFETARAILAEGGYEQIGIDHFALPQDGLAVAASAGRLRRNFQGYTDDQARTLIGLGASAISEFPEGYAQNAAATAEYLRRVEKSGLSVARGHVFFGEDRLRKAIIEALMCDFVADLRALGADRHANADVFADAERVSASFDPDIVFANGVLSITEAGRPLARIVAQAFDAYGAGAAGHSKAI